MHQTPDWPPTTPRPARRRAVASAVIAAAVLGLAACGADPATDTSSAPTPSAATAAPSSTQTPQASASAGAVNGNEVFRTAPDVAQAFVQQALGDPAVVNSPTVSDAVDKTGAFLTDSMAADLLAKGNTEDAFHLLPFKIAGLSDGQAVTDATATITSAGILQTTDEFTQVRVVADYTWTFGPQGWLKGTRTYELVMRPGADPSTFAWQVSGMTGSDAEWTLGDG